MPGVELGVASWPCRLGSARPVAVTSSPCNRHHPFVSIHTRLWLSLNRSAPCRPGLLRPQDAASLQAIRAVSCTVLRDTGKSSGAGGREAATVPCLSAASRRLESFQSCTSVARSCCQERHGSSPGDELDRSRSQGSNDLVPRHQLVRRENMSVALVSADETACKDGAWRS